MDTVFQLIGSYGFPIIMCLLMYKSMSDSTTRHEAQIQSLNDKHKEEMDTLTEAITNNTNAINLLAQKMGEK